MRRPSAVDVDARPATVRGSAAPVVLTVLALLAALVVGALPAAAHDTLLATDPADGAELDAPPEEVVLTFSADQLDVGAAVVVADADGTDWAAGETVVDGPRVRQALDPDLPAGTYTVRWRSVSSDGHTLDGELSFTVTGASPDSPDSPDSSGTAATAGPEETAESTADADPTSEPTAEVTTAPSATPAPEADGGPTDEADGTPVWLWVLLGVAAVGGVVTALVRRGPR